MDNKELEVVKSFKYLGAIVSDQGSKPEIISRIGQTVSAITKLKTIWKDRAISISSKIRLLRSLTISIFLYACETWTVTKEMDKRIQALEMKCFRRILGITYKDRVTNEEVKRRIKAAIGPYQDLRTIVIQRKLRWLGHVVRSSGLTKTCLQGTVKGGRKRGRQKTRWEDNIKEWTGLSWNNIIQKAYNRNDWRRIVKSSPVAPQRSQRLRDR